MDVPASATVLPFGKVLFLGWMGNIGSARHENVGDKRLQRLNLPALNKILEALTPLNPMLLLILQLWDRLPYNIGQKIDQPGSWLHLRSVCWKWKAVLSDFKKSNA